MSLDQIQFKLIQHAARRFGHPPEQLRPEQDFFEQLDIDSFRAMELLTELEEAFGVEIPDYEVQGITTFQGLAEVIARRA